MNLYRRTNTGSKRRLIAMTLLVIVLFVFDILSGGKVRALAQSATANISTTSARLFSDLKYSGLFSTRAHLAAQNQALESRVAHYQEQAAAYQALKQENAQLQTLAHLAQDNTGTTTPIVSSPRSSPYGTFLIGAGSADNIKHNALVLTDDGFAIGRVTDVSTHTALVSALFAPDSKINALVGGTSVIFTGQGGDNARAQVPRGVAVSVGDIITSRSVSGRPIGIVGKVESNPADAYSVVLMRLPQNTSSLRFVFVLSGTQ